MKPISAHTGESIFHDLMKKLDSLFFAKQEISINQKNRNARRKNDFYFFGDQSVFPEINSLYWDEYGNPFIYDGKD
jgi:hypothetical protein